MVCKREFIGRLPNCASPTNCYNGKKRAPGKITIETANSFRHVITRPLNEMIFNSLYFAVIQVKTILCPPPLGLRGKMIYAVFWQTRLGRKSFVFAGLENLQHFNVKKKNTSSLIGNRKFSGGLFASLMLSFSK